ncbi:DMT family transporter [Rhodophyticola porphyridii]|uniref:DMT family transporter n=1 Tax=Rhodophyticola porphyridii TaxID=1852017 RepID=A0A3L9YA30_9RHOB|nr:DMT family transporter [Rhodophyticola porphyridii]RMA44138.1 DMT family transporter [Rhodophyticola porphyridii]
MTADRPLLGILLMLGFCIVIPVADALAKILGDTIPLLQLILVRFGAQAGLLLPFALLAGAALFPTARIVRLTFLRTILQVLGLGLMFTALRYLPLADAVAIAFVMPFILLILGKYFLGEEVGPRRLIACAVGFAGTLMVVQPSFAEVGAPALLPLGVALVFALFMLVTRKIAKEVDPVALQAASGLMALPLLLPLFLFAPGPGSNPPMIGWIAPQSTELWLLAAVGVFGVVGHLLMTWSLRFAPSATLAPMQYLEIPMATLVGWLVFRDLPDGLAAFGIALTIASGLYVVLRERAVSRAAAPPAA